MMWSNAVIGVRIDKAHLGLHAPCHSVGMLDTPFSLLLKLLQVGFHDGYCPVGEGMHLSNLIFP